MSSTPPELSPEEIRFNGVKAEILETEKTYNEQLRSLHATFTTFLEKMDTTDNVKLKAFAISVNSDIIDMISCSDEIIKKLNESSISAAIKTLATKLNQPEIYTTYNHYMENLDKLNTQWSELLKNEQVRILNEEFKKTHDRLDIATYLIKPLQRLPRYPLLIRDLLKVMKETDPNKPDIQESLETIEKTVMSINQSIKEKEEHNKKLLKNLEKHYSDTDNKTARSVMFSSNTKKKFFNTSSIHAEKLAKELNKKVSGTKISISKNTGKERYTVTATIENFNETKKSKKFNFIILKGAPGANEKGEDYSDTFHIQVDTAITSESERKIVYDLMEKIGKSVINTLQMPPNGIKPVGYTIVNPTQPKKIYERSMKSVSSPSKKISSQVPTPKAQPDSGQMTFLQKLRTQKKRGAASATETATPKPLKKIPPH